jgi:hypothetical protein
MNGTESVATLLAQKDYGRAVPLLKVDLDKYPSNPRIRLQYAEALAGSGRIDEAIEQYESTAKYYDDNGLTVQAIAVRKKSEKVRQQHPPGGGIGAVAEKPGPVFQQKSPKSPLLEILPKEEQDAVVREMVLESYDEGDVIISEGEPGTSMYLIASGEVKVYTRSATGERVYLSKLGEGDFFGEVSVLTGKPRTATITACQHSELLRLDKEKLDQILTRHPKVRLVIDDFYKKRANHTVEAMIESLKKRGK